MKVRVTISLDIDPEAWTRNYGVEGDKAIREDVRVYVEHLIAEHLREMGTGA